MQTQWVQPLDKNNTAILSPQKYPYNFFSHLAALLLTDIQCDDIISKSECHLGIRFKLRDLGICSLKNRL